MTDLEITKKCAEKMGMLSINGDVDTDDPYDMAGRRPYDPLHDDAQAMALVKRLGISIRRTDPDCWDAWIPLEPADGSSPDLNRAICECVAKMP